MPNESFLQRWARLKTAPEAPVAPATPAALPAHAASAAPAAHALPAAGAPRAEAEAHSQIEIETVPATPLPTLADAAMLGADSDYSAFVARGVDADVRRLAMKKLFADPHFNRIDGLDIYMGDYNLASPVSPAMLASLSHARSVFARIDELLDPAAAAPTPSSMTAAVPAADPVNPANPANPPAPPSPNQESA